MEKGFGETSIIRPESSGKKFQENQQYLYRRYPHFGKNMEKIHLNKPDQQRLSEPNQCRLLAHFTNSHYGASWITGSTHHDRFVRSAAVQTSQRSSLLNVCFGFSAVEEAALSRLLDDIERQVAEDNAMGGPSQGTA